MQAFEYRHDKIKQMRKKTEYDCDTWKLTTDFSYKILIKQSFSENNATMNYVHLETKIASLEFLLIIPTLVFFKFTNTDQLLFQ